MEDRRLSGGEGLSTPGPSQCACPLPIARRGRCRALCVCRPVDVPAQHLWRAVLVGSGVHSDRPVVSANPACHQSRESPDLNLLIPIQTCCRPPLPPPWARSGWRLPLGLQSLVVCVHRLQMDTLGIEPRASRMLSGCDTTTPCAHLIPASEVNYSGWAFLSVRGKQNRARENKLLFFRRAWRRTSSGSSLATSGVAAQLQRARAGEVAGYSSPGSAGLADLLRRKSKGLVSIFEL